MKRLQRGAQPETANRSRIWMTTELCRLISALTMISAGSSCSNWKWETPTKCAFIQCDESPISIDYTKRHLTLTNSVKFRIIGRESRCSFENNNMLYAFTITSPRGLKWFVNQGLLPFLCLIQWTRSESAVQRGALISVLSKGNRFLLYFM